MTLVLIIINYSNYSCIILYLGIKWWPWNWNVFWPSMDVKVFASSVCFNITWMICIITHIQSHKAIPLYLFTPWYCMKIIYNTQPPCIPVTKAVPRYPESHGSSPYVSYHIINDWFGSLNWCIYAQLYSLMILYTNYLIPAPSWVSEDVQYRTPAAESSVKTVFSSWHMVIVLLLWL